MNVLRPHGIQAYNTQKQQLTLKHLTNTHTHTHTHTTILRPFFQEYPGEPVPEEETSSGLYGARGNIRDRHTDNLAGHPLHLD